MSSKRSCPVCGAGPLEAKPFLKANLDTARLDEFSYASRKTPEYMNLNLVQCTSCDLVYADEPPTQDDLAHAYHVADYDSAEEAEDAAATYIRPCSPCCRRCPGAIRARDRHRHRSSPGASRAERIHRVGRRGTVRCRHRRRPATSPGVDS